jgi:uncharacterized protein YciI
VFVVTLTYLAPLHEIDAHLDAHVAWLQRSLAAGHFLASGPRRPRTGGIILATVAERDELLALLAEDPFHVLGLARHDVEAFEPTRVRPGLERALADALGPGRPSRSADTEPSAR